MRDGRLATRGAAQSRTRDRQGLGVDRPWLGALLGIGLAAVAAAIPAAAAGQSMSTLPIAVGLPAGRTYQLRDVWQHTTTTTTGSIQPLVGPEQVVLYRVHALPPKPKPKRRRRRRHR